MTKHDDDDSSAPAAAPLLIGLLIVAIVGILVGTHHHSQASAQTPQEFAQSISPSASAESTVTVIGTLAPLGSFEYETSPLKNRLAVDLRHAGDAYLRQEISRDQASEVKAEAENARAVIAQATRLCKPAAHTGKCRGSREKVDELLQQARSLVLSVHDYAPGLSYSE